MTHRVRWAGGSPLQNFLGQLRKLIPSDNSLYLSTYYRTYNQV